MSTVIKSALQDFLDQGRKLEAMQLLRKQYGVSLSDARRLVEALENERKGGGGTVSQPSTLRDAQRMHLTQLLRSGDTFGAVRYAREQLGGTLVQALATVKEIQATTSTLRVGSGSSVLNLGTAIFAGVGLILLVIGGVIAAQNKNTVRKGERIVGTVVRIDYKSDGGGAAVIQYEWQGQTWLYRSHTRSNPPAYSEGEKVDIYVNPEHPDEIVVDTFVDRWMGPFILGTVAVLLVIVPVGVSWLAGRNWR